MIPRRHYISTYLILVSLLSSTPVEAGGFVVTSPERAVDTTYVAASLPEHRGYSHVSTFLLNGGLYRRHQFYLSTPRGYGSYANLIDFNYVDGILLGPQLTIGHMTADCERWEVSPMVRYGCSSHEWQGELSLRYIDRIDRGGQVELSGGVVTQDFNATPFLHGGQAAMAMSLFGWDRMKFYRLTHMTLRAEGLVSSDCTVSGRLAWQRRAARFNSRHRNIFGHSFEENLTGFPTTEVLKCGLNVRYMPHRTLLVYDDMEGRVSQRPTFFFDLETITNVPTVHRSIASLRRRERWEIGVEKLANLWRSDPAGAWTYRASVGCFTGRRDGLLMDMKHFEASRFGWQSDMSVSWFTNLDDYAYSTDRAWAMAGASYIGHYLLLPRYVSDNLLGGAVEVLSMRCLKIASAPLHTEFSYMLCLGNEILLGPTISLRDQCYDGIGMRLVINTSNTSILF